MSDWLTAVSVISAAGVSILSIFFPSFNERQRRKEEKVDVEIKKIDETTLNFLHELSNFRHWTQESLKKIAVNREVEHLYTDLQVTQYAWEQAIWSGLDDNNHMKVKNIRSRLIGVHTENDLTRGPGDSDVPTLADEILVLSRIARSNCR